MTKKTYPQSDPRYEGITMLNHADGTNHETEFKDKWIHVASIHKVAAVRNGWIGVWDALIAALKGDKRLLCARDHVMELHLMPRNSSPVFQAQTKVGDSAVTESVYIDGIKITEVPK